MRPLGLEKNKAFEKLISIRRQILGLIYIRGKNEEIPSNIEECNDLVEIINSISGGRQLLESYFSEFEILLNNSTLKHDLLWFDTITLYFRNITSKSLQNSPIAVFLSPFHPICLGWQYKAQSLLKDAVKDKMPCPIAGLLAPSKIPSCWVLQKGKRKVEYISTRTNLAYWRVFWNAEKIEDIGTLETQTFLKSIGVEVENSNISLSSNQVVSILKQIRFLLPTLSNYQIGVIGNDNFHGFNDGVQSWLDTNYINQDKDMQVFDQIWERVVPTNIEIFDQRNEFSLPQNDYLNNLVNEKGVHLSWYKSQPGITKNTEFDLGIITKIETYNAVFENNDEVVDSGILGGGVLRMDYGISHGDAIIESKRISNNHGGALTPFERLIIEVESTIFKETGKNAYKYNPGVSTFSDFINNSKYSVVSSSLNLAYILRYSSGQFKLWDYELPKYGKDLNSQDGYYMVSGHSEMHKKVVRDTILKFTGESIDDKKSEDLLNWMNALGILSLKNLASGGTNSVAEVGILVSHLILQQERLVFKTSMDCFLFQRVI